VTNCIKLDVYSGVDNMTLVHLNH